MFIRSIILLFLLLNQLSLICQANLNQFTDLEKVSFVEIYLEMKFNNQAKDLDISPILDSLVISKSRYKEIIEESLIGHKFSISPNELVLIERIRQENEQIQLAHKLNLIRLCEIKNIEIDIYFGILEQYKTDIRFQKSLMSIFQSVMR